MTKAGEGGQLLALQLDYVQELAADDGRLADHQADSGGKAPKRLNTISVSSPATSRLTLRGLTFAEQAKQEPGDNDGLEAGRSVHRNQQSLVAPVSEGGSPSPEGKGGASQ